MSSDLDREIAPWFRKAGDIVTRRLADARTHAEAGRPAEARDRLAELRADLVGHIETARVAFYREAATARCVAFDPDAEAVVRRQPILGQCPSDIARDIESAIRGLAMASNTATVLAPDSRSAVFGTWETSQRNLLLQKVRVQLSDAQVSLHNVIQAIAADEAEPAQTESSP